MSNFNSNISSEAILKQLEEKAQAQQKKETVAFDPKNYLNVRLAPNEMEKTLTIRLLPSTAESDTPFTKVHMHSIKVNKEIQESGWKTFVCPTNNHMGDECPFCSMSTEAYKLMKLATNPSEKNKYKEISTINRVKTMWVVRCIERGHEQEGVKFWLIPDSKDGAYAKIMALWTARWKKGQEKGVINNIFDLNNGKDIDVTVKRSSDGKSVFSVVDSDERTPLTNDFEQGLSWINDSKKWSDVYKVKPFEYMEIIACGGVPVFDKEKNKYVDKNDALAEKEEEQRLSESNAEEIPAEFASPINNDMPF